MKTKPEEKLSIKPFLTARINMWLALAFVVFSIASCRATQPLLTSDLKAEPSTVRPTASYADVVSQVAPAVVTVRSERRVRAPQQYPFYNDPFFHHFFGLPAPQQRQEQRDLLQYALGSGVIVHADGYVITNHHVIDGAEEIKIVLSDNRSFDAKVI
ncbi:MAG TPA: trypsin-like peptidase domain-containing protein, partial [Blastocatellia bacterium]